MGIEQFRVDVLQVLPALKGLDLFVGFTAFEAALKIIVARILVIAKRFPNLSDNSFFVIHTVYPQTSH
jgi:hypothetical protein